MMDLYQEFDRIMQCEYNLRSPSRIESSRFRKVIGHASSFDAIVRRVNEVAKSSFAPRPHDKYCRLNGSEITCESIGAHANLTSTVLDTALCFYYNTNFGEPDSDFCHTVDDYSYREIMEAIRLRDLPEDIASSMLNYRERDKVSRRYFELRCHNGYQTEHSSDQVGIFEDHVLELLVNLYNPKSPTGRLMFLADRVSTLAVMLCLDSLGRPPMIRHNSAELLGRSFKETALCDYQVNGCYKASEMWALDFFHIHHLTDLDKSFFYIGLVVMLTLFHNKRWYDWRERDYHPQSSG